MVADGAFSHKIDYFTIVLDMRNPKGHPMHNTRSKVTAILLKGWFLSVGGAASRRVWAQPAKQACFYIIMLHA